MAAASPPGMDDWRVYFERFVESIERDEGSFRAFVVENGLGYFGFSRCGAATLYREWAPAATCLHLVGDFNGWQPNAHACTRNERGVWELLVPDVRGASAIAAGSRVKVLVGIRSAEPPHEVQVVERVPAWIRRTTRDPHTGAFAGVHVDPSAPPYEWRHAPPARPAALVIYEAHVGISSVEATISGWAAFARDVLPRVASLGYNALQLMAVQEHGCYESFGYHVTSFFAPACRFGAPDELKALVDAAHGLGLTVLMDVVHSHASANAAEGISRFDGSRGQYFHAGSRGVHRVWGSRLFDYGRDEVVRFLLCNLLWYASEYRFDGFRFDAVTTMLYTHRGLEPAAGGAAELAASPRARNADGGGCAAAAAEGEEAAAERAEAMVVDVDAVVYLMLANTMLHEARAQFGLRAPSLTIAEECTGHAALCAPPARGGMGFDARLAIGLPPLWVGVVSDARPGHWPVGHIVAELCKRRARETTIAYAECHDQSLVGAQTLAFRLMGSDMYHFMSRLSTSTPRIEFGLAALKCIRLLTSALGGEGWLTFMGNEFGHPEWIDFPRKGNGFSMERARRRWDLVDDALLRYRWLNDFDRAMNEAALACGWLSSPHARVLCASEPDQLVVFERAALLFVANLHPERALNSYALDGVRARYPTLVLSSDDALWGGRSRTVCVQPGAAAGEALLTVPPACIFVVSSEE